MKKLLMFQEFVNESLNEESVKTLQLGSKGPEVSALQQKLIDLKFLNIPTPTGTFGTKTDAAVRQFQDKKGLKVDGVVGKDTYPVIMGASSSLKASSTSTEKPKFEFTGFVIPFAFPAYEPKVDGDSQWDKFIGIASHALTSGSQSGTYGKLGHGGIVTVDKAGNVIMFEFGRYPGRKAGYGLTRKKPVSVKAKIVNEEITNLEQVLKAAKAVTFDPGPKLEMKYVVIKAPDVKSGIAFANNSVTNPLKYEIFDFKIGDDDANCGTFALDVIKKSGVNIPSLCFPAPIVMIAQIAPFGEKSGAI